MVCIIYNKSVIDIEINIIQIAVSNKVSKYLYFSFLVYILVNKIRKLEEENVIGCSIYDYNGV